MVHFYGRQRARVGLMEVRQQEGLPHQLPSSCSSLGGGAAKNTRLNSAAPATLVQTWVRIPALSSLISKMGRVIVLVFIGLCGVINEFMQTKSLENYLRSSMNSHCSL